MPTRTGRTAARSRGFTLIELLIGAALAGIVFSAVAMAFMAGSRSFQAESGIASAVEGQRAAVAYIERLLRQAGYGIDPRFAFDVRPDGLPAGAGTSPKDNYAGFADTKVVTDDLAFRYRDPMFLARGVLDGTTVKLEPTVDPVTGTPVPAKFGVKLKEGQPLIVMCPGAQTVAVGRTTSEVAADGNTVSLTSYWTKDGDPFEDNQVASLPACMTATGTSAPYVMLMHDVRIRVIGLGTNPMRPYLVVFHNHDPIDGNEDYDPIAADVENFQIAYQMNRPPENTRCGTPTAVDSSTDGNWVLGDKASVSADILPDAADTVLAPTVDTGYDETTCARYSKHPANIRAVRFSLVLRSRNQGSKENRRSYPQLSVENFEAPATTAASSDGFFRTLLTGSVRIPNLTSRGLFVPPLQADAASELNAWGG